MILKQIRTCTDAEAIALTRERPRLFYSVPAAYEARPVETFKACALAALEGLAAAAGHTFTCKQYGNPGWDAHHITQRIFEEQTIFDPYADETFVAAAVSHCCYYTLRYTDPDALGKASDFTLDQFADCFTTRGVLYLHKRGCDFWEDDAVRRGSDLENYRLYLEYCNKDGRRIIGDVSTGLRHESKRGKDSPEAHGLHTNLQIDKDNGCYAYHIPGYTPLSYDYTRADVLRLINSDSAVQYSRIEIVS